MLNGLLEGQRKIFHSIIIRYRIIIKSLFIIIFLRNKILETSFSTSEDKYKPKCFPFAIQIKFIAICILFYFH